MSYQWYSSTANNTTSGVAISGATGASYTPSTATAGTLYYYVIVTNNNVNGTKTATATSNLAVIEITQVTNAEDLRPLTATLYPNPTDGLLTLEFETQGQYVVTISDMNGKILLCQTVNDTGARLDLSNYPAGVYLLTIDDGKRKSAIRVVKNGK